MHQLNISILASEPDFMSDVNDVLGLGDPSCFSGLQPFPTATQNHFISLWFLSILSNDGEKENVRVAYNLIYLYTFMKSLSRSLFQFIFVLTHILISR